MDFLFYLVVFLVFAIIFYGGEKIHNKKVQDRKKLCEDFQSAYIETKLIAEGWQAELLTDIYKKIKEREKLLKKISNKDFIYYRNKWDSIYAISPYYTENPTYIDDNLVPQNSFLGFKVEKQLDVEKVKAMYNEEDISMLFSLGRQRETLKKFDKLEDAVKYVEEI